MEKERRLVIFRELGLFLIFLFWQLPASASDLSPKRSGEGHRLFIAAKKSGNFGEVAENLFSFGQNAAQLVKTVAIISGIVIVLFSILQYGKHRKNPDETTLGTVFMIAFIGLGLIGLAFIPMLF